MLSFERNYELAEVDKGIPSRENIIGRICWVCWEYRVDMWMGDDGAKECGWNQTGKIFVC